MTDHPTAPDFERLAAHAWAADLLGVPWPERLLRVREDRAFATPSFIELSISLGRDFGLAPVDRQRWAQLAVEAAMRARSRRGAQLEPLAWAVLGNARRVRGNLSRSHAAFLRCQALRHRIGDQLEFADTCCLEASYWSEIAYWSSIAEWAGVFGQHGQQALINAAELIDEALRLATPRADPFVVARYEINAGIIARRAGREAASTTMLLSAVDHIDPEAQPRLGLVAGANLTVATADLGRLEIAMRGLLRLEYQYPDLVGNSKSSKDALVHEVVAAGITWKQDRLSEAERRFRNIRERFAEQHLPLHAADTDVSIAALAAERGRSSTAERLLARAARTLFAAGSPFAGRAVTRLLQGGVLSRRLALR